MSVASSSMFVYRLRSGVRIDGIWFNFEVASFNQGDKPEICPYFP